MGGYKNRILRVDLSAGTITEGELGDALIREYIGGRGFGAKLLFDDLRPGVDPLGPENEIVITTGPLAGTNCQGVSRWELVFKSPAGNLAHSSGGGDFAAELKFAGFDAVVVCGKAEHPVYLWVHDGRYELRDARYLWGLKCSDTHQLIREELHDPNVRMATIGPAGEKKVNYAGVFSDRCAAARGGGGAVMGAKNLKAVAVRGRERVPVADAEAFSAAVRAQIAAYKANPRLQNGVNTTGTVGGVALSHALGYFPTKNFRGGMLPGWERIEPAAWAKVRARKNGCYACMIRCKNIMHISEGRYRGEWTEGPEYESIFAFAGGVCSGDMGMLVAADHACDDLGMDTISAGVTISMAYELYERGIIGKDDTGGLELTWGNDQPVLELLRRIAFREGIGDILAEGTRGAARRIGNGAEQFAMQVKGLELGGYDPRALKAQGLSMITTSMGGDHNGGFSMEEVTGVVNRFAVEGKGQLAKLNQDKQAFRDTASMCVFPSIYLPPGDGVLASLLAACTGISEFGEVGYLLKVGERIVNLERMFNAREGFDRRDDTPPARVVNEPMPDGPSAGQVFEAEQLLADYYQARGWDAMTGNPTSAKLEELGLSLAKV